MDWASLKRGQEAIASKNEEVRQEFLDRFASAIASEMDSPQCTSIEAFCQKFGFSKRTFYKPHNAEQLRQVRELPGMKKPGNPQGWAKNAWYVD